MAGITQLQIAKEVGLSRSAVEKVLNPRTAGKLPEKTRRKILEAAERLGYRPHRFAQVLRRGTSQTIGVIYSAGPYQAASERALYCVSAIREAGYHPLAIDTTFFENDTDAAFGTMIDSRVDGLVVLGTIPNLGANIGLLQKAQIPVTMVSYTKIPGVPRVYADNRLAFLELTRHVLGLGHKNLAFLSTVDPRVAGGAKDLTAVSDRAKGFRDAIKEAGGAILADAGRRRGARGKPTGFFVAPQEAEKSWFDLSGPGSRVAARMLAQVHRPDAILCSNDYLAIGAAAACADAGLRVPDNIAVTGFDNINMGAYLPGAPLTTVAQPSEQMAKKAVEILLALIRKASREHLQMSVELPCSLVVRASCGAGPKRLD